MSILRNLRHQSAVARYFARLDRCDQATLLIISALVVAISFAASAITLLREPDSVSQPAMDAPPPDVSFAATSAGQGS
jgi:hypothetical protein